jgi:hypothetical protein
MFTVPYDSAAIAASPNNDTEVNLAANMTAGEGILSPGAEANTWTLKYTGDNSQSIHSTARIISSKNISGKLYTKTYILNIEKTVDPAYPTSYWATQTGTGNGVSIIKKDGTYYEIHTFITNGTLTVTSVPSEGLTAQVLVVAGGGGAGAGRWPSSGAGAGGMVENNAYLLPAASYQVVVGAGGIGGTGGTSDADTTTPGTNGGDSSFGDSGGIVAKGGGASGRRFKSMEPGSAGGSSGGGSSSPNVLPGTGGNSYGYQGGVTSSGDYAAGGGGAGGTGTIRFVERNNTPSCGGPGKASSITGTSVTYAAGGSIPVNSSSKGISGAANTGNGGGGGWNRGGGNGGSGIVVVRFQARPNDTGSGQSDE